MKKLSIILVTWTFAFPMEDGEAERTAGTIRSSSKIDLSVANNDFGGDIADRVELVRRVVKSSFQVDGDITRSIDCSMLCKK